MLIKTFKYLLTTKKSADDPSQDVSTFSVTLRS